MKLNKESLEKLGLPEDATEEQVNQALANADITPKDGKGETAEDETPDGNGETETPSNSDDAPAAINEKIDTKVNSIIDKRFGERDAKDLEQQAETLVNSAVDQGKINPADKAAWLNSAKTDFDGTKKTLDERKANSSMPTGVQVTTPGSNGQDGELDERQKESQSFRNAVAEKTPELINS